ncbi:MAG: hypothetical protein GY903_11715 [Fuerstiella sp.]|nr:hypothetical protein [Fuerstiella sp.]
MRIACLAAAVVLALTADAWASDWKVWTEAEDYVAQDGSQQAFFRMERTASGGRIVDNDWGRDVGDFLRWKVETPEPCEVIYLTVRFCRAPNTPAAIRVRIGNRQADVRFPPTGGWGFENEQWQFGQIRLPGLAAGQHVVELTALGQGSNLNTDGLFVSNHPPAVEGRKVLLDDVAKQRALAIEAESNPVQRRRLLEPFRDRIQRIVFTKHFDMGGSHYAYTDAVSDEDILNPHGTVKEFNFTGGSSLCLLEIGDDYDIKQTTLLHDEDGVFRDPDVSFDGQRILFAWKKSARDDDYHLYEMDFETRRVRQLTYGQGFADYEGVYLPNGNIMFSSTRCMQNVDCWHVSVSNMYLMDGDGKYMRRIGYDQVHTNYPQVHPTSGLVTYTRWEYNDRGQIFPQPLFRMYPNGAQQTEYYGNNSYFPTTILHARGIPGTGSVLAVLSGHHTHQRGKLAVIDPSRGRQETSGVTLVAPVQELSGTIRIDRYGQDGDQWQYPYPLDEDNYLVTFRPSGEPRFGIYFMNKDGARTLLAADPSISCNQAVPLAPRPIPPQPVYSTDWRQKTGGFAIQDVYHGQGLVGIRRGTVRKLRVVALDFMATDIGRKHGPSAISDLAAWDVKVVLGEAPVYEDGSAAFEVPARTPVYFQAIDAKGHVVQSMRSWSTLMPGEVFSCVGCHENKNATVASRPVTMALQAGMQRLKPFYDITGAGFSFPKIIQPILDARCVRCHDGSEPPDLRATPVWDGAARKFWNRSYHELISTDRAQGPANDTSQLLGVIEERSRYLSWIGRWSVPVMIPPYSHGSSRSPLVALLESGHKEVRMTREEMDKISCWIDLALPHSGEWTEGMTQEDKEHYLKVYQRRLDWEKQEARNILDYIDNQDSQRSSE